MMLGPTSRPPPMILLESCTNVNVGPTSVIPYRTDSDVSSPVLSRYMPQKKIRAVKNLLSSSNETATETDAREKAEDRAMPIISYYAPNITLAVTNDPKAVIQPLAMTPPVLQRTFSLPVCTSTQIFLLRYRLRSWSCGRQ